MYIYIPDFVHITSLVLVLIFSSNRQNPCLLGNKYLLCWLMNFFMIIELVHVTRRDRLLNLNTFPFRVIYVKSINGRYFESTSKQHGGRKYRRNLWKSISRFSTWHAVEH